MSHKKTWQLLITRYGQKISWYSSLLKRALFSGPRRLIGTNYRNVSIIQKVKSLFGRISPSLWILAWSVGFLVYAIAWWPNYTGTDRANITHNVANQETTPVTSQEDVVVVDEEVNSPIATEDGIIDGDLTNNDVIDSNIVEDMTENGNDPSTVIPAMYASINHGDYVVADRFDSYMQTSDLVQDYFTRSQILALSAALTRDIEVYDIQISETDRANRIEVQYTISYALAGQNFAETWTVLLRPEWERWKIGTLRCGRCTTNPFFDPDRYDIR